MEDEQNQVFITLIQFNQKLYLNYFYQQKKQNYYQKCLSFQEDEDVNDIYDSEICKPLNVKDMKEIENDYDEGIIHK